MPRFQSISAVLAVVLVVTSVVASFGRVTPYVALVPSAVVHSFFFWELLTYAFVASGTMGVIFGALILWSIGGALEAVWSRGRFIRFVLGISIASAVATVALSYVLPLPAVFLGGSTLTGALWVAYGLTIGRGMTNFWGLPVTGNNLALAGAGFVGLNAVFVGWQYVVPDAFALLFTFLLMRSRGLSNLIASARLWQRERAFKRRASHLKSLDGGRNVGGGSDKFLH